MKNLKHAIVMGLVTLAPASLFATDIMEMERERLEQARYQPGGLKSMWFDDQRKNSEKDQAANRALGKVAQDLRRERSLQEGRGYEESGKRYLKH